MFETVKNLIYPLRCPICDRPGCRACLDQLNRLDNRRCPLCGGLNCRCRGAFCDGYFVPFLYEGELRSSILRMKYSNRPSYAAGFAALLSELFAEREHPPFTRIAHVPFHWTDKLGRDYNASLLVAKQLSQRTGIPHDKRVLRKTRRTAKQHDLTAAERRNNLSDCFAASNVKGEHILLVDDVLTTGSTVNECARALKQAGAASVWSISVAVSYLAKDGK